MREKFARFMAGRYGMDTMGRFTIGLALFLVVITTFLPAGYYLLVWVLLFWHITGCSPAMYIRDLPRIRCF